MESGNLESAPSTPAESDEPPIGPQQSPQQQAHAKQENKAPNALQLSPQQQTHVKPESNICRKNIWGICEKLPSQCRFEHSRDPQVMKDILKFCHDFQNQGCTRPTCTYIHSTKDEQTAFLKTGEIPPFLVLRYNALEGRLKAKYGPNAFVTPQPPMAIVEPTVHPPLHPVQPPLHPAQGPLHPAQPSLHPVQPPLHPPLPLDIVQNIKPPPPPPTTPPPIPHPPPPQPINGPQPQSLAVQQYVSPTNMGINNSTTFSKPRYPVNALPVVPMYHISSNNSQQPLRFDATRPPPPLPQTNNSQAVAVCANSTSTDLIPNKRRCLNTSIPGSTTSHSELAATPGADVCVSCLEREISINNLIMKIDKLATSEVEDKKHYQHLLDNYEKTKKIILAALGPEQRVLVEDYLETACRDLGPNRWVPYSISSPLYDEVKNTPNNAFICNLLEIIVSSSNNRNSSEVSTNMFESSTLMQNLSQLSRRPTPTNQVQDMSQLLQQFIAHCGQTFLLNQITASRTTNVASTSGIVNSRNNHIVDITTSPRQISNHTQNSGQQGVSVPINQTESAIPAMFDPNKPPPNMAYFPQTPTTSPGTINQGSSVHSAQMYQNIMTTQQVGVNVYGSNAPAASQQQTPLAGQQTYMPEQFPLGHSYYNPYHQPYAAIFTTAEKIYAYFGLNIQGNGSNPMNMYTQRSWRPCGD